MYPRNKGRVRARLVCLGGHGGRSAGDGEIVAGVERLQSSTSRRAPDHFPHLTHLDIVFERDEMLSGLVSRFGTPELVTLSITAKHAQELRFISPLNATMPTVRELTLAIRKINAD
ncbi:hypothetical protein DFH09DRAFT_1077461 [Mycena vulgaris]|nr:hypothetical protein DFH09DRAFT_1077461 [Mycena vulgaris]